MFHDNPGEVPFNTRYKNAETLADLGFNSQVGKDILSTVTFESLGMDFFPKGSDERIWFEAKTHSYRRQIAKAKAAGLYTFYHVDMFVFPQKIVDRFKNEMLDNGRISIGRPRTRQLCRVMLQELFGKYPDLDGLIVRVGETYLHDIPYHTGNSAVKYNYADSDRTQEQKEFSVLIDLLRDEICVKNDRYLIFRTWDCFPDRFHADKDYYLAVTDQVKPHEKLVFSLKHTALDFWRRVRFNPSLMTGRHQQIVEVQCQREYEGKGAYPMYHMGGVINGFSECTEPEGLRDIVNHPLFRGVFSWSRGGGWRGPYIKNEFWVDLNVEVLSQWLSDPSQKEEDVFKQVVRNKGLSEEDAVRFRKLCELSQEAVLKGRYCQAFDAQYEEKIMPTMNWLRDDHIAGEWELKPIFEYLSENGLVKEALLEKEQACQLWADVERLANQIHFPDIELDEFFRVSVRYGSLLYKMISSGWQVYALGYAGDKIGSYDKEKIDYAIKEFDMAIAAYKKLASENSCCPTLYQFDCRVKEYDDDVVVSMSEDEKIINVAGLDRLVDRYCKNISDIS